MSRFKLFARIFRFGPPGLRCRLSWQCPDGGKGEKKGKARVVFNSTKWQPIEVGDVEGHILAVNEAVGIITVLEGDKSTDGAAVRLVSLSDTNTKTGSGTIRGYNEHTSHLER